jgi:hypothetical protein
LISFVLFSDRILQGNPWKSGPLAGTGNTQCDTRYKHIHEILSIGSVGGTFLIVGQNLAVFLFIQSYCSFARDSLRGRRRRGLRSGGDSNPFNLTQISLRDIRSSTWRLAGISLRQTTPEFTRQFMLNKGSGRLSIGSGGEVVSLMHAPTRA